MLLIWVAGSGRAQQIRWLGGLGGLRGVVGGVAEEARTRGFPSPSLGGFGFIVFCCVAFMAEVIKQGL